MPTVSTAAGERTRHRAGPPTQSSVLPAAGPMWSRALLLVISAGVPAVLAIWWQDTLPGALRGGGDYLTAAGRVSGLLAAYLLLVLVALMARVPWLENRVGSDVAARYHRSLGEYTIVLAVSHTVLIILGYAWQSGTDPVTEGVTVVFDYADVLLSTVALVLLLVVGVVSARAVRRRLAYETWYHVHLLVYVAIGLAFAHEFAVGADFSVSPRNRLLWSAAHIVVGAAVVVFRVAIPMNRSLRHRLRVTRVVREGPGVVSVHLAGRDLDQLDARAGQFLRWRFLARGHWWQSHPYSLSAEPGTGPLADHREGPRRLQCLAARGCGRARGCGSRDRTALSRNGAVPEGAGCCSSPAVPVSPRSVRCSRRSPARGPRRFFSTGPHAPKTWCSTASWRRSPTAGASVCTHWSDRAALPRATRSPPSGYDDWSPTWPSVTSTCAVPPA